MPWSRIPDDPYTLTINTLLYLGQFEQLLFLAMEEHSLEPRWAPAGNGENQRCWQLKERPKVT